MTAPRQPLHATVVATRLDGAWRGVLIQGRSGAGKSDLALRLMQKGWRLVGDDWVEVFACKSALYAVAPATIAGRVESLIFAPAVTVSSRRVSATGTAQGSPR